MTSTEADAGYGSRTPVSGSAQTLPRKAFKPMMASAIRASTPNQYAGPGASVLKILPAPKRLSPKLRPRLGVKLPKQ